MLSCKEEHTMATGTDKDFKLITPDGITEFSPGDDVTLDCHLSPETSAVAMEIRWFNGTDCVYLYKNGEVTEGKGYEGRVSVDPQRLQRGYVSLTLKSKQNDKGWYTCQVISGEHKREAEISLTQRVPLGVPLGGMFTRRNTLTAKERKKMEESVQNLDINPHLVQRRNSKDQPPTLEEPELRLVLLAGTTAGKRAAGNIILGTHTLTHTSTETQHSESRLGEVAGRRVTLVETPDWFCSGLSEKDMRQDVGLCVRLSAPGPHAFLLVIPVEPSEGEERRMLEKMEDIFGEGCWGHTLILFTHAEGQRERSVEELLQTGSQELQQLVEKCGNRCHLLSVKDRPDDTKVTQLLEKIEEMVSGNRERFYSSETYQEAERQIREIERRIQKEHEERKERKQREIMIKHEKELENYLNKMKGDIQVKEEKICALERRIAELEKELENTKNEDERRELERQLNEERQKRKEIQMEKERQKEEFEKEKREMEERHRDEMEEMRESYERKARAEAERNLLKVILPELQSTISIFKARMEKCFNREMEQKSREVMEKDSVLKEKERELKEKDREIIEKDRVLKEKERELKEKDREINEKDRVLKEKDSKIMEMDQAMKEMIREKIARERNCIIS